MRGPEEQSEKTGNSRPLRISSGMSTIRRRVETLKKRVQCKMAVLRYSRRVQLIGVRFAEPGKAAGGTIPDGALFVLKGCRNGHAFRAKGKIVLRQMENEVDSILRKAMSYVPATFDTGESVYVIERVACKGSETCCT